MFSVNRAKTGDYITFIPEGLLITLQYNTQGNLEKVYEGVTSRNVELPSVLEAIISSKLVPYHVPQSNGTTWVRGVLYTSELPANPSGTLPVCVSSVLVEMLVKKEHAFNFFACEVDSMAHQFKGSASMKQWLLLSKFNTLPGALYTQTFREAGYKTFMNSSQYPFHKDLVQGYYVYNLKTHFYVFNQMDQEVVHSTELSSSTDGNLYYSVQFESGLSKGVSCADVVKYQIQPNTHLIFVDGEIKYAKYIGKERSRKDISNTLVCKYCGGKITVEPGASMVRCKNAHCKSNLFKAVCQFIRTVDLPMYEDDVIRGWIDSEKILCVPDLFVLPEYRDFKLNLSLATLLRAIVPYSYVPDLGTLEDFVGGCVNNVETLEYYISHPSYMQNDMPNFTSTRGGSALIKWFEDGYNVTDLTTLLHTDQIQFKDDSKRFNGAPIFRGKTICITGKFKYGSTQQVQALLHSYSANVSLEYNSDVGCIVVGDTLEGVDGRILRSARSNGKPIFTEADFFNEYGIYVDIQENLV